MEYFTRAWATGDLSDNASNRVLEAYNSYLETLDKSSEVWRFATTIGLNDAWIDRFALVNGNVSLRLLTGDNQRGYWHTDLTYEGARVVVGLDSLEQAIHHRPTEIWYDEFSGHLPAMVHRFLLVEPHRTESRGEFHISFSAFRFSEVKAAGRALPPP
jgi:hypothetical protein